MILAVEDLKKVGTFSYITPVVEIQQETNDIKSNVQMKNLILTCSQTNCMNQSIILSSI